MTRFCCLISVAKEFLERKFFTIRGHKLCFSSTPPSLSPQGQTTAKDAKTSNGPSAAGGVAVSSKSLEEEKEKEEEEDDGVDRDLVAR